MLRKLTAIGALVLLIVAGGVWFARWQWDASHDQMRAFLSRLTDTTTPADVRRIVAEYDLLAVTERPREPWSVIGTYWFGAEDWVAWLEFEDGKLGRVRVRTYDGMGDRPKDGPPDRSFKSLGPPSIR